MQTNFLSLAELESFDSRSPQRGQERRFLCPVCGQDKPRDAAHRSLAVNIANGSFLCHRCQAKGRLKEFWDERLITTRNQKTRTKLMAHFALRDSIENNSEIKTKEQNKFDQQKIKAVEKSKSENLTEKMEKYKREFLHSPAEIYLLNRGISTEVSIRAGCGYADKWEHWEKQNDQWLLLGTDRRVIFPIFDEQNNLIAIHARAIDENHFASPKITRGDKSRGLFLSDADVLNKKISTICEGAIDAMALAICGIPAVAMTGTTPPDWFYKKTAFQNVLIATDADEAGDKAAFNLKSEFLRRGTKFFRLRPKNGKDWGESLEILGLKEMQNHLSAFGQNLTDETRAEKAVELFNCGRKEAALFITEMIGDINLRAALLYEFQFGGNGG